MDGGQAGNLIIVGSRQYNRIPSCPRLMEITVTGLFVWNGEHLFF